MSVVHLYRRLPIAEKRLVIIKPESSERILLYIQVFQPQLNYSLSRIWQCTIKLNLQKPKRSICSLESMGGSSLQALTSGLQLVAGAINLLSNRGYRFSSENIDIENKTQTVKELFLSDVEIVCMDKRIFGRRMANGRAIGQNVFTKESLRSCFSFYSPIKNHDCWSSSLKVLTKTQGAADSFRAAGSDSFDALVAGLQISYQIFKNQFEHFSYFYCSDNDDEKCTFDDMREILFSCCGSDSDDYNFVLDEKWLQFEHLT